MIVRSKIKIISIDGAIIVYTAKNIIYVFIQSVVYTTYIYKNLKESSEFLIFPKPSQVTCSILKHKFLTLDRFYDLVILLPSFFFFFMNTYHSIPRILQIFLEQKFWARRSFL